MGTAKEVTVGITPDRLRQTLAAGGTIVIEENPVPLILRIAVSVWCAWAAFVFFWILTPFSSEPGGNETLDPGTIATRTLLVAGGVYLLWFQRKRLTLNPGSRTFVFEIGRAPLLLRQSGSLDTKAPARLVREWRRGREGTYPLITLRLATYSPKGPVPVIVLSPMGSPKVSAAPAQDVAERLTALLGQTLDVSEAERPQPAPTPVSPWVGRVFLALFGGILLALLAGGLYTWYEGRGPRYEFVAGQRMPLRQTLENGCVARSLLVVQTGGRTEMSGGEVASITRVGDYRITLDVENAGTSTASARFVVGFSGATRAALATDPLRPGAHRTLSVDLTTSEGPTSVFLRAPN